MVDRLWVYHHSCYLTKPPRPTQPGHPYMGSIMSDCLGLLAITREEMAVTADSVTRMLSYWVSQVKVLAVTGKTWILSDLDLMLA